MTESHDLWEDARAAAREDVQRIFASRPRTCPRCGRTGEVSGALCPYCRSPYTPLREKGFRLTPKRLAIAGAVVAVLTTAALLIVPGLQDDAAQERRAAAAEQARVDAAEDARVERDQRPVFADGPARRRGENPLVHRPRLVAAGEAAIIADARRRVAAGTLDKPVAGVQCTPYPRTDTRRALEADPDVDKGRYECFAYERKIALPELEGKQRTGLLGFPYWLVIDYKTSGLTFCKITPRAGEANFAVTGVLVPEPCRDPLAKR
jgi:hypothetical protein